MYIIHSNPVHFITNYYLDNSLECSGHLSLEANSINHDKATVNVACTTVTMSTSIIMAFTGSVFNL